jgi:proline-specific peptidase
MFKRRSYLGGCGVVALALLAVATAAIAADDQRTYFNSGGIRLYYTAHGEDNPFAVILSGGPGYSTRYMQQVTDEIAKTHKVILLEQRATGRSYLSMVNADTINFRAYVADLEALRMHLGVDRITLVGNSWGMMLALAYAGHYPERIRAIVTLGSGPITSDYARAFEDNRRLRLTPEAIRTVKFWSDPARYSANVPRAAWETSRATAPAFFVDPEDALSYVGNFTMEDLNPYVFSAFLEAEPSFDLRRGLMRIKAPVLLLQCRQDIAGEANIYEAHTLIENSKLVLLHTCGHMPWLEQPEQTWQHVNEFLRTIDR